MSIAIKQSKAIADKSIRKAVNDLLSRHDFTTARVVVSEVKNKYPENKEINELLTKIKDLEKYDTKRPGC